MGGGRAGTDDECDQREQPQSNHARTLMPRASVASSDAGSGLTVCRRPLPRRQVGQQLRLRVDAEPSVDGGEVVSYRALAHEELSSDVGHPFSAEEAPEDLALPGAQPPQGRIPVHVIGSRQADAGRLHLQCDPPQVGFQAAARSPELSVSS